MSFRSKFSKSAVEGGGRKWTCNLKATTKRRPTMPDVIRSDSLLLLFPLSPLLDSHATAWLVEGADWRLGRFERCIVDIGATFSVMYPVRPPDSICLLHSSLSSPQSQFPLLFVMSNRWCSFSANCSLFHFLYFSKDFINLSTFADTCCFERKGKFIFSHSFNNSSDILVIRSWRPWSSQNNPTNLQIYQRYLYSMAFCILLHSILVSHLA